jgi:hypothetical protein
MPASERLNELWPLSAFVPSRRPRLAVRSALAITAYVCAAFNALAIEPPSCTAPFRYYPGTTITVLGQTRRDSICVIRLGYRTQVDDVRVTLRASNGIYGTGRKIEALQHTAYRPNPGFVGQDQFELEVRYTDERRNSQTARLRFVITVLP